MPDCRQVINSIELLGRQLGRDINIMEVCGTHTASIYRYGIKAMLPSNIHLISGPGCPVCVTAQEDIDALLSLADSDEVLIACYGDMLRVPGHKGSLAMINAVRNNVKIINSTAELADTARHYPDKLLIFWAVGFETTTPMTALAILEAQRHKLGNFKVFCRHKTMPQVLAHMLEGNCRIDALLCPGHVAVINGAEAFESLPLPAVISGFEAIELLTSIELLLKQLINKQCLCQNNYPQYVKRDGNAKAKELVKQVFEPCDAIWRGIGEIKQSGLCLRENFRQFDAESLLKDIMAAYEKPPQGCLCGDIIAGKAEPLQCRHFAKSCTPLSPIGPCMVSSEGSCSAYYKYGRC